MTLPIDPLDVSFMTAAEESDRMLRRVRHGWEPPCDAAALRDARVAAMRDMIADLPNAAEYAMALPDRYAVALVGAQQGHDRLVSRIWCVTSDALLPTMRSMGLVHLRYRSLTSFGLAVRAELMKDEG